MYSLLWFWADMRHAGVCDAGGGHRVNIPRRLGHNHKQILGGDDVVLLAFKVLYPHPAQTSSNSGGAQTSDRMSRPLCAATRITVSRLTGCATVCTLLPQPTAYHVAPSNTIKHYRKPSNFATHLAGSADAAHDSFMLHSPSKAITAA